MPAQDDLSQRAAQMLDRLAERYPEAGIYLDYGNPFELLVATILAAQCTDERVNQVTPELFEEYPGPEALAEADEEEVQEIVRSTGFYRRKTSRVKECARIISEEHGGEVPEDLDALTEISGIGRKTANVVLAECFGKQAIPVDTHVQRVSQRLGLTENENPDKIEGDLQRLIPEERWTETFHLLSTHGREICTARGPDHESCPVSELCDYYQNEVLGH